MNVAKKSLFVVPFIVRRRGEIKDSSIIKLDWPGMACFVVEQTSATRFVQIILACYLKQVLTES